MNYEDILVVYYIYNAHSFFFANNMIWNIGHSTKLMKQCHMGRMIRMHEVDAAANHTNYSVNNEDVFGSSFDANLDGKIRVSVNATGII